MKVICIETVFSGGAYNQPGAEIDVPAEHAPRLLKLGAVRLPGSPDPNAWRSKGPGTHSAPNKRVTAEPGIYKLPALPSY